MNLASLDFSSLPSNLVAHVLNGGPVPGEKEGANIEVTVPSFRELSRQQIRETVHVENIGN